MTNMKNFKGKIYCFSPEVMLLTFLFEVVSAGVAFWKYKINDTAKLLIAVLLALAGFQMAEFMVCGGWGWSGVEWARIGYLSITLLPPMGLHLAHKIAGKKSGALVKIAYATMFAQACREIPCLGTTHADQFHGPVPLTRFLTAREVEEGYEENMGRVIAERLRGLDWESVPGVLLAGHAPFTWGESAAAAVRHAVALERIAHMAFGTLLLNPKASELPRHVLAKHHRRKHGPGAYYGQKK